MMLTVIHLTTPLWHTKPSHCWDRLRHVITTRDMQIHRVAVDMDIHGYVHGYYAGTTTIAYSIKPMQNSSKLQTILTNCTFLMIICFNYILLSIFITLYHCDYSPILHRFGATIRFMCSWPHPYSTLNLGVFPLHHSPDRPCWGHHSPSAWALSYLAVKLFSKYRPTPTYVKIIPRRHRQTVGRTDRRLTVSA